MPSTVSVEAEVTEHIWSLIHFRLRHFRSPSYVWNFRLSWRRKSSHCVRIRNTSQVNSSFRSFLTLGLDGGGYWSSQRSSITGEKKNMFCI